MATELSTAGIQVKWAVEASAGVRPTSGFAAIRGVKVIPEIGGEPNNLDVTPLEEPTWRRSIPGLRDPGGAVGLTVNDYDDFRTDWDAMYTAFQTAKASGLATWWEINVPGLTSKPSFYFSGQPSELGFGGAEVDSPFENTPYITINKIEGWAAKSTT